MMLGGSRGVGSTRARAAPRLVALEGIAPRVRADSRGNQNVSSYAIDDGERLLLFDPLGVPPEIEQLAAGRETAIVLTAPWHERDVQSLVERLAVPVYTPRPDTAEDLLRIYNCAVAARQGGRRGALVRGGDRLPVGVEAFPGHKRNDLVLWVESQRAVVAGDTLADFGDGPQINPRWLVAGVTREQVVGGLPAARAAGGAPARDARRPLRPDRPRARALLMSHKVDPHHEPGGVRRRLGAPPRRRSAGARTRRSVSLRSWSKRTLRPRRWPRPRRQELEPDRIRVRALPIVE